MYRAGTVQRNSCVLEQKEEFVGKEIPTLTHSQSATFLSLGPEFNMEDGHFRAVTVFVIIMHCL